MITALNLLRLGRARIADPANWRRGVHIDPEAPSDAPPYCAGAALWLKDGDQWARDAETVAIRMLLTAAGLTATGDPEEEIDALVLWNDAVTHAAVLAAFDKAIVNAQG